MFLKGSIHIPRHLPGWPWLYEMDQGPQVTVILTFNMDYLSQKFRLGGGREAKLLKMP